MTPEQLERKRASQREYMRTLPEFKIRFHACDADLLARLQEVAEQGEARTAYIKRLIREDIERCTDCRR